MSTCRTLCRLSSIVQSGLRLGACAAALSLLAVGGAHAQITNFFFDGDTSNPGDWNDPANWTSPLAPDTLPGTGPQDRPEVGSAAGGALAATVNITGPLTNPSVDETRIGSGDNSRGTVNHSAGTLNLNGWNFVGVDGATAAATGEYNLSGTADLQVNGNLFLGLGGGAGLSQGTLNISDDANLSLNGDLASQAGALVVGSNDGNTGIAVQTGGSVTYNSWMTIGESAGAQGSYDMSGGSLNQDSDWLTVGESGFAQGTLTVSGTADVNLNVNGITLGRRTDGTGTLEIIGSTATFDTTQVFAGIDTDTLANSGTGNLSFIADAAGVTAITASGDVRLNDGTGVGTSSLTVDLSAFAGSGDILLIDVGGTLTGTFAGLAEGAAVAGSGGRQITYLGGDGNDIYLIPEPTTVALALLGALSLVARRKRS